MSTPSFTQGGCVVCNAHVIVRFDKGSLPIDVHGHSGLTADGDRFVCPDHFCPVCGCAHSSDDEFTNCQFGDEFRCDPDTAYDIVTGR